MSFPRVFALMALLAGTTRAAPAQDQDRAAVLATVQKVFDAMRTRDTALLTQAFDSSGRLVGLRARGGPPVITMSSASDFGAAIARAPAGQVWNERIFDPDVRIDGNMAQVWAYYVFHLNATFSHCGVDAFMLRKAGAEWKITQLSDSHRTDGCTHTEPPGASRH